jgi:S-DNA-T family DNA segregation ATPase FtsK/SpoIIIE
MDTGRREKFCSILGLGLICFSILVIIGLLLGMGSMNKLSEHVIDHLGTYLGALKWIIPIMGVYWGWKAIRGGPYIKPIVFSIFVFTIYLTASTFSGHLMAEGADPAANVGGKFGSQLASLVGALFGATGSMIVVVAALAVVFVLTTGVNLRRGALWLEDAVRGIFTLSRQAVSRTPEKSKPRVARKTASQRVAEPPVQGRRPVPEEFKPVVEPPRVIAKQQDLGLAAITRTTPSPGSGAEYKYPPTTIFEDSAPEEELQDLAAYLEGKLSSFDISARVVEIHPGPVITRFEVEPGSSTKVHQVVNLADDLALALKARSLRILAPIPGKGTIGIEVPNKHPSIVRIKEILASKRFTTSDSKLELAIGKDVAGNPYTADLEAMPHLLIAGATGSGKSVCINTIITSLVHRNSPQDVQLLLIDPKRLELNMYEGIPHLVCEVVTEAKKAVRALGWVVEEMDLRYQLLARRGVRNIQSYEEGLPYIVVVIDELADLMLMVPQEIEMAVTKLAQMARAVGIHLVMATQRPSVDVITGVIKANFPCRMAFKVASKTDSRTILDANGAERLLGKGDMLVLPPGTSEPIRVHGAFVSSEESKRLVDFLKTQSHLAAPALSLESIEHHDVVPVDKRDELFEDAARIVITHQQGSVSLLQRRLKVGYSRAARLIDFLEEAGIVGPFEGSKARQVLVDETYLENLSSKL